jgi:hypothetical protein
MPRERNYNQNHCICTTITDKFFVCYIYSSSRVTDRTIFITHINICGISSMEKRLWLSNDKTESAHEVCYDTHCVAIKNMDDTFDNLLDNKVLNNKVFDDPIFDDVLGKTGFDPDKYKFDFTNTITRTPLFAPQPKETAVPVGGFGALSHSLQPRSDTYTKKGESSGAGAQKGNGAGELGGEAQRIGSRMWLPR